MGPHLGSNLAAQRPCPHRHIRLPGVLKQCLCISSIRSSPRGYRRYPFRPLTQPLNRVRVNVLPVVPPPVQRRLNGRHLGLGENYGQLRIGKATPTRLCISTQSLAGQIRRTDHREILSHHVCLGVEFIAVADEYARIEKGIEPVGGENPIGTGPRIEVGQQVPVHVRLGGQFGQLFGDLRCQVRTAECHLTGGLTQSREELLASAGCHVLRSHGVQGKWRKLNASDRTWVDGVHPPVIAEHDHMVGRVPCRTEAVRRPLEIHFPHHQSAAPPQLGALSVRRGRDVRKPRPQASTPVGVRRVGKMPVLLGPSKPTL